DPRNFHRKVTGAEGFLVETGSASSSGGRPAQLYRRGDTDLLHPPMLRPRPPGACEPVRQSPGGPVGQEPAGHAPAGQEPAGQAAAERALASLAPAAQPDRYISVTPDRTQPLPALEDDDVRADATFPAGT
ncbi:MAG TPA: hypothetical protein VLX31_19375, partial [Streptosporangiaceae bacterium]|nr:hypothetical protein [Streptosporangiaceae bacterium]